MEPGDGNCRGLIMGIGVGGETDEVTRDNRWKKPTSGEGAGAERTLEGGPAVEINAGGAAIPGAFSSKPNAQPESVRTELPSTQRPRTETIFSRLGMPRSL